LAGLGGFGRMLNNGLPGGRGLGQNRGRGLPARGPLLGL